MEAMLQAELGVDPGAPKVARLRTWIWRICSGRTWSAPPGARQRSEPPGVEAPRDTPARGTAGRRMVSILLIDQPARHGR